MYLHHFCRPHSCFFGLTNLPNKPTIEEKTKVNVSEEICTVDLPLETEGIGDDPGRIGDDPSCPSISAAGSPRLCWEAGREGRWLGGGVGGKGNKDYPTR